jgi:hypothetical protein
MLIYTGSSVSGIGYGYSVFRDDSALGMLHAVRVSLDGRSMIVSAHSYIEAVEIGQAFCATVRRERALKGVA